ncbi:MAG TPA: hypothetical protein DDZ96_01010 [Porphyromonadaceae bacterium]|jgi:outer membrane murein-binding lipoprotein Lpp|nr:hypothetical protein [Porphyromonadaceae bacterium]HBL32383.1 hypothetical protein [Porphyromonadaceae bacterium]HBX21360.1 hypothetical protein [Porphyromonadaceae bacterium]HCM19892.1 hypothetical protein [Porphyromonadaceae bacterium]
MKRTVHFILVLLSGIILYNCSYDDTEIWSEINKIKTDVTALNTQLSSLKTIVDALNEGKVIMKVEAIEDDKEYKITLNDGTSFDVLKGEITPVIGVGIKEFEGAYYWAIITNGNSEFLLDGENKKIPLTGENGNSPDVKIDEEGYWTANNIRIKDAEDNDIKAQGYSFFKGIKEDKVSVTFILPDGNTIILPKSDGTYLQFKSDNNESFFVFNPGDRKKLSIEFSNIQSIEIVAKPNGWTANLHRPDKYVEVIAPKDAGYGIQEIILRGLDKNGMVFMAIAKVSIAGKGFSDPLGVFILNEGNMTTENGSLIYISPTGEVFDDAYLNVNGTELGNVTQDLFIKDGKMYIISQNGKIAATGTAFNNDGMLVVVNAETLKRENVYDDVFLDEKGKYKLDWPTHIAVLNDQNIFIRDNHGIHLFNSTNKDLKLIDGTKGAAKNRMAVANNKVFAIVKKSLIVLEANGTGVAKTIDLGATVSGLLAAKDGNLWVSTTGSPNKIVKINSKDYSIIRSNEITEGKVGAGWGATPGITAKGDTLYYSNASTKIYRHIFSTGESKFMVDAKTMVDNANIVYNNIAVHPVTGDVYLNTIKAYGWDFLINNISVFNFDTGTPDLKANYKDYTHFPAGIFFTADFK